MREPRPLRGGRALLFDRLIDLDPKTPHESKPYRALDGISLRDSVRREISRLLNTRCPVTEDRNGSVIDYGVPDFGHTNAASESDRNSLAATLARRLAVYEPRLRDIRLTVMQDPLDPLGVMGSIEGTLVTEWLSEPVSFPLSIHSRTGKVDIAHSSIAAPTAASG